jgi:hypothetical protein
MRSEEFINTSLNESRGLFGRSQGDIFVDDNGNEIKFDHIDMMPSDRPNDAYQDEGTMLADIKKLTPNIDAQQVNQRISRARAFAIATLKYDDGSEEKWIKWANVVPSNLFGWWKNNEVPTTGPRWVLKTKTAAKARSGLTPQDLIKTDKQSFGSVPSIVDRVAANLPETIKQGIGMIANGQLPAIFVGQKDNMEAIRDHLGEIIQPIALMSGLIKGDADKAANDVLGGSFAESKVVWPQSKNTGLIDSYFIGPSGRTLGISSKGNKGANASVQNIENGMKNATPVWLTKNKQAVSIIRTIGQFSAKEAPIALGIKLRLISEEEGSELSSYVNIPSKKPRNLNPNLKDLMAKVAVKDYNQIGYSAGYHMLAGLAKQVCEVINSMPDFSKACMDILNQSDIMQIYTEAKIVGQDVHITGFRSVYPPTYSGSVNLTSGKVYYATGINGKFTFDYKS